LVSVICTASAGFSTLAEAMPEAMFAPGWSPLPK